jgi:CPA1 family monovalent cation:H+ antiporter
MSMLDVAALLLTLSALFGWLNRRLVRLPNSIGLLLFGLAASLLLVLAQLLFRPRDPVGQVTQLMAQVDFSEVVMKGVLAFILFAGALNVDWSRLKDRAWPVAALAVVGTAVSTLVVGGLFWLLARLLGQELSLPWALVFGALISPTDPVAVLSTLKNVQLPQQIQVEMQGEALFNDGIGIVLFTWLVTLAAPGGEGASIRSALLLLAQEAGGGLVLGLATGYLAYRAMRAIDDFPIEVLITLALVAGTYALADRIGASGPLSVVAAGLLVGERAPRLAMSERTQNYVSALWTLIDEVLNSVLFLLIGLEVLVLRFSFSSLKLGLLAIPIVLVGRVAAVSAPLLLFATSRRLSAANMPFLTWAGVRGGISIALALSLPVADAKSLILTATYMTVIFSIGVQASTVGFVARHTLKMSDSR